MRDIRPGVRRLFHLPIRSSAGAQHDAEQELDAMVENHVEHLAGLGMTPEAARAEAVRRLGAPLDDARREVGSAAYHRERRLRLNHVVDAVVHDIRYALRGVRLKPWFAVAIIVTLGLGLGANAAMFGIVDRQLFRPPAFMKDPGSVDRIYTSTLVRGTQPGDVGQYANFVDITAFSRSYAATAGFVEAEAAVGTGESSHEMQIAGVSGTFFDFFDAAPAVGRYFTAAEDSTPRGAPVTVLSYAAWQTIYGGRHDVLGAQIQIGAATYTAIGVAPRDFVGLWPNQPPAFFIPITAYAADVSRGATWLKGKQWWRTYNWGWMSMMARRRPGVSLAAANADLAEAYRRSYRRQIADNPRSTPESVAKPFAFAGSILPDRGPRQSNVSKVANWVAGVALIVLLIACANVANLLLVRALRRRREIALRLAIGASRRRLVSQLLTESALLAALGGVTGLVIAKWGGALLRSTLLPNTEGAATLSDGRTLVFAAAAVALVALLIGLVPAFQTRGVDLTVDLKAGVREGTRHRSRVRTALLVFQAALSVVLLVGTGLFVRSFGNLRAMRLGYDSDSVLVASLNMRGVVLDSASAAELRDRLFLAAKTVAGVEHAALQRTIPFWNHSGAPLFVEGIDTVARLGRFEFNTVSPEYFATMGTRIIRGRGLTELDAPHSPRVMVVSDAMGKRLWPDQDPIGKCVRVNADTMPCTLVVGIAENIMNRSLTEESGYFYYIPFGQFSGPQQAGLFIRARGDSPTLAESLRRRLQHEMPGASYVTVTPFARIVGEQMQSWRLGATMFAVFGGLALVLAAVGLYSVIAYDVQQRTHELGVRAALGAQTGDVVRMIVGEGVRLAGIGVVLGGGIALWAGRWVKPLLFDEAPRDPAVFAFVLTLLVGVAAAASWVPAVRAARVDPQTALRSE